MRIVGRFIRIVRLKLHKRRKCELMKYNCPECSMHKTNFNHGNSTASFSCMYDNGWDEIKEKEKK